MPYMLIQLGPKVGRMPEKKCLMFGNANCLFLHCKTDQHNSCCLQSTATISHTELHHSAPHYTTLHHTTLHHTTPHYTTLHHTTHSTFFRTSRVHDLREFNEMSSHGIFTHRVVIAQLDLLRDGVWWWLWRRSGRLWE